MIEGEADFAGFGGDGRIDGSAELKDEVRGVASGYGGGEVGGDAANKKTVGLLVESCGTSQEAREKGIEGGDGDEAASIFNDEFRGEIGVAALNAGARLVDGKFSEDVVVVQTPAGAVLFGADGAERFEEFEEADVVVALSLNDR